MTFKPANLGRECFRKNSASFWYRHGDPLLIQLSRENTYHCTIDFDTLDLYCEGEINWAAPVTTAWQARIGYICDTPEPMTFNFNYTISLEVHLNSTCRPTAEALSEYPLNRLDRQFIERCSTFYPSYSLFNHKGMTETDILYLITIANSLDLTFCYKHLMQTMCRIVFPECIEDNQPLFFCLEMCESARAACEGVRAVTDWIPNCAKNRPRLSEGGRCRYIDVTCENDLVVPDNGYVNLTSRLAESEAKFYCNDGYELVENATSYCSWNGDWVTPVTPECVRITGERIVSKLNQKEIVIYVTSISGFILLLVLLSSVIIFKYKYRIIVWAFRYCKPVLCCTRFTGTYKDKTYHAYIAYDDESTNDTTYAQNIHKGMENYGFKVMMECLHPPNVVSTRYASETIARSHSAIILLTQNFLQSENCQFMLDQAFYQNLANDHFSMIIIFEKKFSSLKNLPVFLKRADICPCISVNMPRDIKFIHRSNKDLIIQIYNELRGLKVIHNRLAHITRLSQLSQAIEESEGNKIEDIYEEIISVSNILPAISLSQQNEKEEKEVQNERDGKEHREEQNKREKRENQNESEQREKQYKRDERDEGEEQNEKDNSQKQNKREDTRKQNKTREIEEQKKGEESEEPNEIDGREDQDKIYKREKQTKGEEREQQTVTDERNELNKIIKTEEQNEKSARDMGYTTQNELVVKSDNELAHCPNDTIDLANIEINYFECSA